MLKKIILLSLLFWSSSFMVAQAADDKALTHVTAELPIYGQKIRFQLPINWKHAFTNRSTTNFIVEFIPKNEDIANWKNLFSIQGFNDLDTSPKAFADNIAQNFSKVCPNNTVYAKLGARSINGFAAFEAIIGCANMPADMPPNLKKNDSEISFFTFIKGQENMYLAQKAYRSAGFSGGGIPPEVQQAITEMQIFLPLEICALSSPTGQCK